MAVGVVVGGAFGKIVTSLVSKLLKKDINIMIGMEIQQMLQEIM